MAQGYLVTSDNQDEYHFHARLVLPDPSTSIGVSAGGL